MNAAARGLMAAHAHPDDPSSTGTCFFWPNDILRAARPTEEFPLIDSKVETEMPETDLIAGVRA